MTQRAFFAGWQSGFYQTPQEKPEVSLSLLNNQPYSYSAGGGRCLTLTAKSNVIPFTLITSNLAHMVHFDVPLWQVGTFRFGDFAVEPNIKPITVRTSNLSTRDISNVIFGTAVRLTLDIFTCPFCRWAVLFCSPS
jgi:hypothetical protein